MSAAVDNAKTAIMYHVAKHAEAVASGDSASATDEYVEIRARLESLLVLDRAERTEAASRIVADYQARVRQHTEGGHA